MITGDHADTAAAVAREVGISGDVVTGAELDRMTEDQLAARIGFHLVTDVGAILTLLGASLAGLPIPLTAAQLLWINIIMDGPPAMALAVDPARDDAMSRPPRDPRERVLDARRLWAIGAGAVMAMGTVGLPALTVRRPVRTPP